MGLDPTYELLAVSPRFPCRSAKPIPGGLQYFEARAACPPDVRIPTEDSDAWLWYPDYRWVYDKIAIAHSQGLDAGPHGVPPPGIPRILQADHQSQGHGDREPHRAPTRQSTSRVSRPATCGMTLLDGRHVSSDIAVVDGEPRWWRHVTGEPSGEGTFDYWTVHGGARRGD